MVTCYQFLCFVYRAADPIENTKRPFETYSVLLLYMRWLQRCPSVAVQLQGGGGGVISSPKILNETNTFLAYLPYFEKNKSRLMRSRCCLCVCVSVYPLIVARQRLGKNSLILARQWLGKNPLIVARQRLGKNPPVVVSQRLTENPLIVPRQRFSKKFPVVPRQRLGRNVTAVKNTHATIEELLDASFSMCPVS
jgi:hypothetical protein